MAELHTREFFIIMPEVEMKITLKGKYADVETEYIRMEAVLNREGAKRKEEDLRRALGEPAKAGGLDG